MTDQSAEARVTATIRAAYKWALRDNPNAEVCPNCHGTKAVIVKGTTYPCPCQNDETPKVKPKTKVSTNPLQLKLPQIISVSQNATSDCPKLNITVDTDLGWFYDELTKQLHGLVLGMTGAGKTNTMYVIIEELLRANGLVTIIDPEGDYRFLKSEFPILIIGKGRKGNPIDIPVQPGSAHLIAKAVVRRGISVVLDLSGFNIEDKNEFVAGYVEELWNQYQDEDLSPMRLIVDEVQLFAPQNTLTASKKLILDIASRGRKRHLTLMVATQRPQKAEKDLLDGMDIRVFHRLKRGSALNAVRDLLPYQLGSVQGKEINNVFANMIRGQATFEMEGKEPQLVQIRPADTYHPGTEITTLPLPIATVDASLIEELQRLLGDAHNFDGNLRINSAQNLTGPDPRIASLESENQQLSNELTRLRDLLLERDEEIALLKLAQPVAPVITEMITTTTTEFDGRSPLATARAVNKQRREFGQFLNSLTHQHSGAQRAMLKFLIQNEANTYTLHEIARFSGYSVSTLAKLPQKLISGGYIWRQRGRKPIFKSTARSRLAHMYPDLNTEALVGEILKVCR